MDASALLYALAAATVFGLCNVFSCELSQKIGSLRGIVVRGIVASLCMALAMLVLRCRLILDPVWLGWGAPIAVLGYIGFFFFMLALRNGKVGVIVPAAALSTVVAAVFGVLCLGEVLTGTKIIAAFIIVGGVMCATIDVTSLKESDLLSWNSGVPQALVASVAWGIAGPLYKFPSDHLGVAEYSLYIEIIVTLCAVIQLWLMPRFEWVYRIKDLFIVWPDVYLLRALVLAGVTAAIGSIVLNRAYQVGEPTLVTAIFGAHAALSVVFGAIVHHERLTVPQYIGASIVAVGILLPAYQLLLHM